MRAPAAERFEALWTEHAAAVLRYARRRVAPDDVDDVVAETFVVAWRRIEEVPAFALPWLLGVARHVSANQRRSGTRRDALRSRLVERVAADPGHDVSRVGLDDSPAALALTQLPEADRELLTLIASDRLSNHEADLALGCSRSTLAVRLHRARRRFAALLEGARRPATAQPPDDVRLAPGPQPPAPRQSSSCATPRAARPSAPTQPTGGSW